MNKDNEEQKEHLSINISEEELSSSSEEDRLSDGWSSKIDKFVLDIKKQASIKEKQHSESSKYFNKKRKYKHLTRAWYDTGSCAWAPRIRNRVNLDSTNTFRIAKKDIEKIKQTMDYREPIYQECSHYSINAFENNLPQIAHLIWKYYGEYQDSQEPQLT